MSEHEIPDDEKPDDDSGYVVAAKVTLDELMNKDAEDESLQKYKQALAGGGSVIIDADNPKKVIVKSLVFAAEGRPTLEFKVEDLGEGSKPFTIKEGSNYQFGIRFHVQRDMVLGLKMVNSIRKFKVSVSKETTMIGSFSPKEEIYAFNLPTEEAPTGMMARGQYKGKIRVMDDDGDVYVAMKYYFEIKKDWD